MWVFVSSQLTPHPPNTTHRLNLRVQAFRDSSSTLALALDPFVSHARLVSSSHPLPIVVAAPLSSIPLLTQSFFKLSEPGCVPNRRQKTKTVQPPAHRHRWCTSRGCADERVVLRTEVLSSNTAPRRMRQSLPRRIKAIGVVPPAGLGVSHSDA
uniref:Uncharacterized protein n=1 Tax=Mycena chlorophos TaxID=658473 RepID=A0ABQ0L2A2_MYCCL|nr:predicted protein [Mycena chlorophos]